MIKNIWKKYNEIPFVLRMSAGFLLGIVVGLTFKTNAEILKPLGTILIRLLTLIAVPVIFLTVVQAVNQMSVRQLGRMGSKLILYYATTTAAAVAIGLGLALWFNPGSHLTLPNTHVAQPQSPHFSDILLRIVPDNMFHAFASGDTMAVMFLALIIGMAVSSMKFSSDEALQEKGNLIDKVFSAFNEMLYKLLDGVLAYMPIGVFAIAASSFGQQGIETLYSLLKFTGVFYLGIVLLWIFVYAGFLKATGTPVLKFLKQTKEAYATAFFTSSSIASLPIAITSAKKAGVSERVANFSLPLGAIFNSDGGALRMGVSIVFAANVTQLHLSLSSLLIIVLIGTLLSIGTAGVPAAGLVTLTAILTMFGLPLQIVALIAGVDAIIGMGGTASNVMGDIIGAAVVDKLEQKQSKSTPLSLGEQ